MPPQARGWTGGCSMRADGRGDAACARMRAPHRRVDEVADAGQKHARYERLSHQQKQAAENGEPLSGVANLVRSEIEETIEISIATGG